MNTIENNTGNAMKTASDVIIHLGAGLGSSAALYQELGYKQLILIEASTELTTRLSKKFRHQHNVHIKNNAISAQNGHVEFNSYSNPRYGSQLALESEFLKNTNLHLQETKQVSAITFAQLLEEFKLTNTQYNTLILELNGYEVQFLTSLPLAELSIFSKIIVTLQATARYVNQTNAAALNTALIAKGFRLTTAETNQCIYEKDEELSTILQTHAEQLVRVENLHHERDALTRENSTLQESLRTTATERDEQAHWNQKNKEWAEALQQEIATLKQQLEQENLNANNIAAAQQQELAKKAEELLRVTKERDEQAHWHQKNKEWVESLHRDIEALKKDYAEGERAQSLALKLQAKAQVDLEHLRTQYQQKLQQEQNLIELIHELQLKLQAAANYYHQLQLQHPELNTDNKQSDRNNTIDVELLSRPTASKRAHKKRK